MASVLPHGLDKPCTQARVGAISGVAGQMFGAGGLSSLWVASEHVWLLNENAAPWLARLRGALHPKSVVHPELGYPKITQLLKRDGWDMGKRLEQRLRQKMRLKCSTKKLRFHRRSPSTGLPTKAMHSQRRIDPRPHDAR